MELPKIGRLLKIMKMLTSNNRYSIVEIAERLNTDKRTVYRYLESFRDAGFVVKKCGGFYRLDKSSPHFKDISELIHFTEEEAYILKSAIESIDENHLLKQCLKKKLYTVYDYKILADTVVIGKNAKNVKNLVYAMEEKRRVIFHDYSSANGKDVRDRLVEPFAFTTNYVQVWCFDLENQNNKLFNVSRITSVNVLQDQWTAEESHQSGFIDIFRISSNCLYPVKLRLGVRAVSLLMEEYPLSNKYIQKVSDREWLLQTEVCSMEGIGRFVLGLSEDIQIIDSPEFSQFIHEKIEKLKENFKMT